MRDVLADLDAWAGRGEAAALATVVAVKRSAPRPPGAKMAVSSAGAVSGAVSGGCVEGSVVLAAEEVLAGGPPRLLHFGIADEDAWDVGLPCGGEIDVWVARHEDDALGAIARRDERGAQVTRLDDGAHLVLDAAGTRAGTLGDAALDDAAAEAARELMWAERSERLELEGVSVFVDVVAPAPRLVVFGAVDFAAQLCTLARITGWRPFVVDPRTRFATAERFPDAEQVVAAWPAEAFARIGGIDRATYVAVLTHDPKLDDAALLLALRSDAAYVGAMGSRRAQERRRERLLALGLTDADLERLAAPIGLDLGALTAEETALSILSEVVAVRHGHQGGRLIHAAGRIHEVGA
ncbi:XdhC family protein [Baekduia soli]|uniref:XdhC family protein n=1 Tax=Baekduia soli TaxID=496014 RepID=A0A5B8U9U0_9ACTN|nr:XdhC/CoxI family protein [Baekduia soli]QEC49777.1 XdhC family protein [Baekduia soli]